MKAIVTFSTMARTKNAMDRALKISAILDHFAKDCVPTDKVVKRLKEGGGVAGLYNLLTNHSQKPRATDDLQFLLAQEKTESDRVDSGKTASAIATDRPERKSGVGSEDTDMKGDGSRAERAAVPQSTPDIKVSSGDAWKADWLKDLDVERHLIVDLGENGPKASEVLGWEQFLMVGRVRPPVKHGPQPVIAWKIKKAPRTIL
jgi:hypothetical protein